MPRYFFNVRNSHDHPDQDGTVLSDIDAARIEAVRLSGAMLKEHGKSFWQSREWRLEVCDDRGLILFTLIFVAYDAPGAIENNDN